MDDFGHSDPNGNSGPNPDIGIQKHSESGFQEQQSYIGSDYNNVHHGSETEIRHPIELPESTSNETRYTPPDPSYTPTDPRYDPTDVRYTPTEPRYAPTDARYTPTEPRYAPTDARYTSIEPRYAPTDNVSSTREGDSEEHQFSDLSPKVHVESPGVESSLNRGALTKGQSVEETQVQSTSIEINSPQKPQQDNDDSEPDHQNKSTPADTNQSNEMPKTQIQDHMRDLEPFLGLSTTSQERDAISTLLEVSQQLPLTKAASKSMDTEKPPEGSTNTADSQNKDGELPENDQKANLASEAGEKAIEDTEVISGKVDSQDGKNSQEDGSNAQEESEPPPVMTEDSINSSSPQEKPQLVGQEASQKVQYQVSKALEAVCREVLTADSFIYVSGDLNFRIDDKSLLKMTVSHNIENPSGRVFRSRRSRKNFAPVKKQPDIYVEELSNEGLDGNVVPSGDDLLDQLNQDLVDNTVTPVVPKTKRKMWYHCDKCNYSTKHVGFYKKHQRTKHSRQAEIAIAKAKKDLPAVKRPRGRPRKHPPVIIEEESDPESLPDPPSDNDDYIPDRDPSVVSDDNSETPAMKTRSTATGSNGKFKCEECPYTTDHSGRYKDHMNKHRGVRPFSCNTCPKSFLRQDDLRKHEETHNRRYECSMCATEFPERSQLKEHMKVVHNEEGRLQLFPCDICKKNLSNHADLEKHMEAKHNHICTNCGETFTRLDRLRKHRNEQHPSEALTCTICLLICASKGALRKHMHRHRAGNKFPCEICGRTFTAQSTLYHHKRGVHSNLKPYQCTKCDKRFNFHHSLKLHVLQHEGVRPYKCDRCDKTYLTATHLKSHKQAVHEDKKKYLCVVCNKRFPYENSLKMHMMLHTGDRPYLCNICGRGFINHSALKTHEASHVDSKQWECEICKKMYKTEALLRAHRRRHTGEGSRFMCDICGHTFMYKSNLEAHYTVHSNERKYTCQECGSTFKTAATLYSHRLVHSTDTPFTCTVCSKAFKSKERKLAHERRHLGDKPFQCEICGRSFPDKGGLTKHCKTVHAKTKKFSCPVCKKSCSRADNLRVHMRIHRDPTLLKLDWKSLMTSEMDDGEMDLNFDQGPVSGGGLSGDGRRDQEHGVGSGGSNLPHMMGAVTSAQSDVPSMAINTSASSVHHHMQVQPIDHRHGDSNDLRHPTPTDMGQGNDHRQPTDLRQHSHRHPGHHHTSSHMQSVLVVPDPNLPPHHHHHHPHHHPMNPGGGGGSGGVQQHHLSSISSQVLQPPHSLPAPPPAHHQQPNHPLQAQDYDSLGPMQQDPLRAIPVVMPPAAHSSTDDGSQGLQPPMSHHMRDYAEVANAMLFMQYQNLQNTHQ